MSETRRCPVRGCHEALGHTRQGDPWLMCRKHYHRLSNSLMLKLWTSYKAWQRLERQRLRLRSDGKEIPPALLSAIAEAMSHYLDVRHDCIEAVKDPDVQLEIAQ